MMVDSFKPMGADAALSLLGRYSRWQIGVYILFSLAFGVIFAWVHVTVIFIGDTPEHRCYVPHLDDSLHHTANTSHTTQQDSPHSTWLHPQLNESVPYEVREGELVPSQCLQYVNFSRLSNSTQRCTHGYMYDPGSGYVSTISTDWDLVCGKNILVELSMTINGIGSVLGNVIYPVLADRLGRRPIFLFCLWGMTVFNTIKAFSPNYLCYAILCFLSGCQEQGMMTVAIVMALELFPTEQRTFAGNAIEFSWALGQMTLAPIAYFCRNWRHLVLAAGSPTLLSFAFYWWVPESIPWLVANGKHEAAEKVLRAAAKVNKITLPESVFVDRSVGEDEKQKDMDSSTDASKEKQSKTTLPPVHGTFGSMENVETQPKRRKNKAMKLWKFVKKQSIGDHDKNTAEEHKDAAESEECAFGVGTNQNNEKYEATLIDLAKNAVLRKYTLALIVLWFSDDFVYISLALNLTSLAGDRYLNFFLYALVEVPAYIFCWTAMEKLGRIRPIVVFNMICGASLLLTALQLTDFGSRVTSLPVILSMIGKFAVSASWATVYVLTPEVYPTNIRNTGIGVGQFAGRSAMFLGPYTRLLARSVYWLPPVLLGILSIIAGFTALLLVETRWRPLPETVEQVESWDQQSKFKKPTVLENEGHAEKAADVSV